MLQKKRQTLIRQHRRSSIRKKLASKRESELLKVSLKCLLVEYKNCALVTGDHDYLGHERYLDCQTFVYDQHEKIKEILNELQIEESKQILMNFHFSEQLYGVMETIQNKTLQSDQEISQISFKSRNRVLTSVASLLSLFSEDEELITPFGRDASRRLIGELIKNFNTLSSSRVENYSIMRGLINLFRLEHFQLFAYDDLYQLNFQLMAEKMLGRLASKSQFALVKDSSALIVSLLYQFFQFQKENTTRAINSVLQKKIAEFSVQVIESSIEIDKQQQQNISQDEVIDSLLSLLILVRSSKRKEFKVLTMESIFKKISYVKYLHHCSNHYGAEVSLNIFTEPQLRRLLESAKQLEETQDFEIYLEYLTSSLANMLLNSSQLYKELTRLQNLLYQTKTVDLLLTGEKYQKSIATLRQIFDLSQTRDFD